MNIPSVVPTVPFLKSAVADQHEAEQAQYAAPKNGPVGRKPLTPGQIERKLRRLRRSNAAAVGRKSRRKAVQNWWEAHSSTENLRGIARVYLGLSEHATDAMRANVKRYVEDVAETRSTQTGTPYTKALQETEAALRQVLVSYGELDEEEVA